MVNFKDNTKPIGETNRDWKHATRIAIKWLRLVDFSEPLFQIEKLDSRELTYKDKVLYYLENISVYGICSIQTIFNKKKLE